MRTNAVEILLIDDDDSHRLLLKRALKDFAAKLYEARSPAEAENVFLQHQSSLSLVILDMNLNGISSLPLLKEIRRVATLQKIPVAVLSTSGLDRDVFEAYAAGANCYLVKSTDPNEFRNIVNKATQFLLRSRA